MDILFCTDKNYVLPSRVMVTSLLHNNRDRDVTFHVFCDLRSEPDVLSLSDWIRSQGAECRVYPVSDDLCSSLPFGKDGQPVHVSITTYYRLFMPSILPDSLHKVLYLDGDLIVRRSLDGLWNTDLSAYAIGCIQDMDEDDISRYNRLRYHPGKGYFNAGVLLVNLDYWRANDVQGRCLQFACEHQDRILFHDQDILNYVLQDEKLRLPFRYNVQDGFLHETKHFLTWPYADEMTEMRTNPVILHYTTSNKPWNGNCDHPYLDEYLRYVALSGLSVSDFPKKKVRMSAYMRLRSILVRLGFFKPLIQFEPGLRLEK